MLTRKQHELLMLIHERMQAEGIPPSFEEMKDALALKSKSGIHRLITALEERGFIRRLPNRARALEVIRLPEGYTRATGTPGMSDQPQAGLGPRAGFEPKVIEGGVVGHAENVAPFPGSDLPRGGLAARYGQSGAGQAAGVGSADDHALSAGETAIGVPVMGRIAAGVPIAAIQEITHSVAVPPAMIGSGEHFALEVEGDSMIEAGILDGDTVIIRRTPSADPGEIVVALVDDEEATLKKYYRQGGKIALEAANPAYETRLLPPERVEIQGQLAGLIRRY